MRFTKDEMDRLWCQRIFNLLVEGGTWGVPRSGLVFKKQAGELVLVDMMPHVEDGLVTVNNLLRFQQEDYEAIKEKFELAGISVRKLGEDNDA